MGSRHSQRQAPRIDNNMIFKNFEPVLWGVVGELAQLLNTEFLPNEPVMRSAIGRSLVTILRFHEKRGL